ncbi:MAG: cytochrome c family protein [Ponticaulis sp.]|nr:cytochrome c family protein [Ponticaulis sp.]|tara:strand:- start:2044 stop:2589 length:546 start_codon:yes stop_codon:yes gene_type:complete
MRILFTTTAMALMLAACGGSEEPATSASTPSAEVVTPTPLPEPGTPPAVEETPVVEEAAAEVDDTAELIAALPAPYNEADYKSGERVWKQCATCHRLDPADGHRTGPNLHGIFDRHSGAAEEFRYSKVLEEADFQWTPEEIDKWLASPKEYLEGNRMSFAGVRRPNDRRDVIAYMLIESNR